MVKNYILKILKENVDIQNVAYNLILSLLNYQDLLIIVFEREYLISIPIKTLHSINYQRMMYSSC